MKITETITRKCCDAQKDLRLVEGHPPGRPYYFCVHCGLQWEKTGGSEPGDGDLVVAPRPWEIGK